jgi:hypothetical protein
MSLRDEFRIFKDPAFLLILALLVGSIMAGGLTMKYFAG